MTNDIEIISRKEAKERGLKRYFTGKPCKHGHIAERLVSNSTCFECTAERQKEHSKQNKDKIAKRRKEYYNQNKDKLLERQKEYRSQNKDKIAGRQKDYYNQNKDKIDERQKEYNNQNKDKIAKYKEEYSKKNKDKISEYRAKNKDKMADAVMRWRRKNPAQGFLRNSLNRIFSNWKGSRKKMEKLHGYTFEQLVARIEFQFKDGMSWENRSEWHIDHRKPISRFLEQGITDPKIVNALSNLRPMWASENLSKGAKFEL